MEMHILGFQVMTPCSGTTGTHLPAYHNVTVLKNITYKFKIASWLNFLQMLLYIVTENGGEDKAVIVPSLK